MKYVYELLAQLHIQLFEISSMYVTATTATPFSLLADSHPQTNTMTREAR